MSGSSPHRLLRGLSQRPMAWILSVLAHVALILAMQLGSEPARSKVEPPPQIEVVEVMLMDSRELRERRRAHEEALAALEREKRRAEQARRAEARKKEEARKAEVRKKEEARKRRLAEKRKVEENKRKREAENKRKAAQAEELRKKQEAENRRREAQAEEQRKKREAEKRLAAAEAARERARAEARHKERLAARASLQARQLAAWAGRIRSHVEKNWNAPAVAPGTPCEVVVEQDKTGHVRSVEVRNCKARKVWQDSLRHAVRKASPLPLPPDPALAQERLVIVFHPSRGSD